MIKIKRIYAPPHPDDGFRVLIDGLWPRGIAKEKAQIDVWLKAIAPSKELRMWYGKDVNKWEGFVQRYAIELSDNPAVATLRELEQEHGTITLLYAKKEEEHNNAVALLRFLG